MPSQSDSPGGWKPGIRIRIDRELAESLTEQFNSYACYMEGMDFLNEDFVYDCLLNTFEEDDLNDLIDDEFGKGIIMGQILALSVMKQAGEIDEEDGNDYE